LAVAALCLLLSVLARALAAAALLAAAGVAAYGWVKAARAGKAQQRATKPDAREAGGG
jgi:opacity protein-like surface antigen